MTKPKKTDAPGAEAIDLTGDPLGELAEAPVPDGQVIDLGETPLIEPGDAALLDVVEIDPAPLASDDAPAPDGPIPVLRVVRYPFAGAVPYQPGQIVDCAAWPVENRAALERTGFLVAIETNEGIAEYAASLAASWSGDEAGTGADTGDDAGEPAG